jgi:mono/diheme cytochrome c family protein
MIPYMRFRRHYVWTSALFAASFAIAYAQLGPAKAPVRGTQAPPSRAERTGAFLGLGAEPDRAAADRGDKLYASNCAFCHGPKAKGGEGPDLVRSMLVLHDDKGDLIGQLLQKGRPDKGMPAFPSLSAAQVSDIAASLHMRVYLSANRGLYKVQNVVTGNPQAGEAYFNGPGQCSTCHSVTGDLAHVAAKYQPSDLQAAFLYPGSVSRFDAKAHEQDLTQVTVTLPSGQSVTGSVKRLDDFVVSLYDSAGEYHSWPRTGGVKVTIKDPLEAHRELLDKYTDADMHNLLAYLVTLK